MPVLNTPACPQCKGPMTVRAGKFGNFFGCMNFPKCRGIVNIKGDRKPAAPPAPRQLFTPSPEQSAIFNEILAGTGHLVIAALAGTGKSTTCREAMWLLSEQNPHLSIGYTSFGKDQVDDFKTRAVPAGAICATTNGLGHRSIMGSYRKATLDNNKVDNIVAELWQPTTEQEIEIQKSVVNATKKLVGLVQSYMVEPSKDTLDELVARHDVELSSDVAELVYKLVPQVLKADRERPIVFSYSDQLWLPVVLGLPMAQKFDVLFVDEAQDLNKCQHELVIRHLKPGGRLVIVGDNNQAIFGFRGSDVDSIPNLSAMLADRFPNQSVTTLPLNVSRRCPKAVIAMAQQYVPAIQALPDAPEGKIVNTTLKATTFTPGDMVVCRMNAPLVPIAFSLIRKGIKAIIRGRDIGQGLITLIDRLRPRSVNDLLVKLDGWVVKETANAAGTRHEATTVQKVTDQADCIRAFCDDCDSVTEVKGKIVALYADFDANNTPRQAVVLSSIHKAKGLEADTVVWACPEITFEQAQEWQARQEDNLRYVAITRAKQTLVLAAEK